MYKRQYLNGLTGEGVHIVTVNDYLARRDSEWMGKLYRFLGLTVGLITHDASNDERRRAYAADITYGTNNELGFDYLRDNMVVYKNQKVQRGHAFAIVDEVDSILIDEARTPLIISGPGDKSTDMYERADKLAKKLTSKKFVEIDNKEDNDELYKQEGIDYIVDEKAKTATLTPLGVKKVEEYFGIENLTDPENVVYQHHINQAIKAHGIMRKDIDYVVKDGEVIIVDESTGRLMYGRRYNEGLHQAIEAKEGVKVERESKTLATVTFQNYFRMYKKLSGMTGTARTEATEFTEIYGLNIVSVPTNRPVQRKDYPDAIYKTVEGKYRAVIEQVMECHKNGQPVLVGTVSVEKSEILAKMLQRHTRDFNVLNAKNHEREAEIVAQAGKKGAITIATNMAGRGTDIMLGGNAEFMAKAQMRKEHFCENLLNPDTPQDADPAAVELLLTEANGHGETTDANILAARQRFDQLYAQYKPAIDAEADEVRAAGGLFIIGTERHESRRIDNQLRGRSGRQGDKGSSIFYISLEDDIARIFGGDKLKRITEMMNVDDDMAISNGVISKQIERAQRMVESRNFSIRKSVLSYDDVMNKQREIIYEERNKVLDGVDVHAQVIDMIEPVAREIVGFYYDDEKPVDEWDLEAFNRALEQRLFPEGTAFITAEKAKKLSREGLVEEVAAKAKELLEEKVKYCESVGLDFHDLERFVLLRNVDSKWMDHIDAMSSLREGIGLRGYGQHNPVQEYQKEGFEMFDEMIDNIRRDTAITLMKVTVERSEDGEVKQGVERVNNKANPVKSAGKVGRNDPCPCGSGKKYKNCCGRNQNN